MTLQRKAIRFSPDVLEKLHAVVRRVRGKAPGTYVSQAAVARALVDDALAELLPDEKFEAFAQRLLERRPRRPRASRRANGPPRDAREIVVDLGDELIARVDAIAAAGGVTRAETLDVILRSGLEHVEATSAEPPARDAPERR